jgi:hypothetical protein
VSIIPLSLNPLLINIIVSFSLVDFNGDGELSSEEFVKFNKDCFLPLIEFLQVYHPKIIEECGEYVMIIMLFSTLLIL